MKYLNVRAVKSKIREYDRQITTDGLKAIDRKIKLLIVRACNQFDGHRKRINAELINFFKV